MMKHKVLAYITRRNADRTQVLVFDHRDAPEAGTQVPAGTVEPGEPVEQALFREVEEESGLRPAQLRLVRKVAEVDEPDFDQRRHIFHLEAASDLPEAWTHTVGGHGEDSGMIFLYRWAGLDVELAGGQHRFLNVEME
jgi:ADP-ribose pyrophosphatase YjhB (NUDIX family)